MKFFPYFVFGLTVLAQWLVPLASIRQHEQTLNQGTLVKIKCSAPDPYDPLRGRYLAVQPEQREVSVPEGMILPRGTQVYATLTTGSDGLATITALSPTPPAGGDFIRVKTDYMNGGTAVIQWPFDRFYLNEKLAPEADRWFAKNIRNSQGILAEVRVLNGCAVLADLSVDGKPFRDILEEKVK